MTIKYKTKLMNVVLDTSRYLPNHQLMGKGYCLHHIYADGCNTKID